jgi:hypothetical protein
MHDRVNKAKRRVAIRDNVVLLIACLLCLVILLLMSHFGMPQKWHAAIAWTAVPFSVMVMMYHRYWSQWRFWVSLSICLLMHIGLMWVIFAKLLADVKWLGTMYVIPFEFVELFILLGAVGMLMRKLGQRDKYIHI